MSNHSGGPPPPNNTANGQEGRLEPIDDHRSQPQRPPNNVSNEHPPPNAIELWNEVSDNLDRNATVVWSKAVDSLEAARRHLQPPHASPEARTFVDTRMATIISILLEQQVGKIGQNERECVEKSVRVALTIVRDDLETLVQKDAAESSNGGRTHPLEGCMSLLTLHHILSKKKAFYGNKRSQWSAQPQGLPEVRNQMISTFKRLRGFHFLGLYMTKRAILPKEQQLQQQQQQVVVQNQQGQAVQQIAPIFPQLVDIKIILDAVKDSIHLPGGERVPNEPNDEPAAACMEETLRTTNAVRTHLLNLDEETLKRLRPEGIKDVIFSLMNIYDKLAANHPPFINDYYDFNRSLVLKLITSASLPLKLLGWNTLEDTIDASIERRPPPRAFVVEGAGLKFINGRFDFDPKKIGEGGWIKNGCDLSYVMKIPESSGNPATAEDEGAGKTLTLFRCTMRSQQKWWFISEADEDQPGTDKDIDYYNHKSKSHEDALPSAHGWVTCRSGVDPAPTLRPVGLMVPPGEEENTLECVLAKWATENGVIELVLGDSIHREIVARSTALIKFLANMCDNDDGGVESGGDAMGNVVASPMQTEKTPNPYCLKLSHLLLAWKTCTSKTDAAVSAEIYNLLVSILPSLPEDLAIPLLQAIHSDINESNHNFFEVSEFCCAIANISEGYHRNSSTMNIKTRVREEILSLQWAILTHEDAQGLKSYENIKHYVSHEIVQTDFIANEMRGRFLVHCRQVLIEHSRGETSGVINENHALHITQLTKFVLECYPKDAIEVALVISADGEEKSSLAELLLLELMAYLNRERSTVTTLNRKPSSASVAVPDFNYSKALSNRLQIIRYVYGISSTVKMTSKQVDHIWSLCTLPIDKEAIMDFLAIASTPDKATIGSELGAVFSKEVSIHIFENLFCSANVGWDHLGELAFVSFQNLFQSLGERISLDSTIKDRAIDALWTICLSAGNSDVATNAMNDLLSLYIQSNIIQTTEANASTVDHNQTKSGDLFSKRIFECLVKVKEELQRGNNSSLRSAERCIKILKRAFDSSTLGGGVSAVAERLRRTTDNDFNAYLNKIPHGLRGVSSCITVSVMAKKTGGVSDRFSMEIHLLQSFGSIKTNIAKRCDHDVNMMKLSGITGRSGNNGRPPQRNFNLFSDTAIAADLEISEGNELIFMFTDKAIETRQATSSPDIPSLNTPLDLSGLLDDKGEGSSFGVFFDTLIAVLESLPASENADLSDESGKKTVDSHSLVWDVLLAMPTNPRVCEIVNKAASEWRARESNLSSDAMTIDSAWSSLIDVRHFERSVYVLQVLDFSLQPPSHLFSCLPTEMANILTSKIQCSAQEFKSDFIRSGGFEAILRLFVECGAAGKKARRRMRMGNEFALRIISTCVFGEESSIPSGNDVNITKEGLDMMKTFPNITDFLMSLMYLIVDDHGVTDAAILKVLRLMEAMLRSDNIFTSGFEKLPESIREKFLTSLLLWEGSTTSIKHATKIRKKTEAMILESPLLSSSALPFLLRAMKNLNSLSDGSDEFFSTMMKLVEAAKSLPTDDLIDRNMEDLGTAVCDKLASYPRPTGENEHIDYSTGVLCGCLNLLLSLVDLMGGGYVQRGSRHLLEKLKNDPWCVQRQINPETFALINLMGTVFDCFVASSQLPGSSPICFDKKSRQLAFRVILAAAQACNNGEGYHILVRKINGIMSRVAPSLRHVWSHSIARDDANSNQRNSNTSKYSGLKNQGCTCYMNSFLQQLFMMPTLRKSLCSAEIPSSLRSSGGGVSSEGYALVGKKISLHWDCGNNYDAVVDDFDEESGMHTISYLPIQPSVPIQLSASEPPTDLSQLPEELQEQFILNEGRPNRETGAFEILSNVAVVSTDVAAINADVTETEDEASSRKLLEEVQRTFVNLDEARGRCFDPRSLVESSNCLKLEFDVWQQNDASEFAMKLLDRLEISLKRWSPSVFKYLTHTFGLKTTKQKICKECGLKTSREENLMNIDCQIRNKSTIHEALSTLCEDEIMEGDNKVLCDRCKVKTNTVLRTAISALPDVLILSLKRFDLDYTTFETVKLNSRCEFEEALNMKQYTLEAKELLEAVSTDDPKSDTGSMMDVSEGDGSQNPLSKLPDEEYEYRLVGVLVHAGVAQGGHYYSFIKDRTSEKWYRFDDEDVTPFDPSLIEQECFGGKVKKETKFPNGHVHTTENEQFANALMLLYEKVKPVEMSETPMDEEVDPKAQIITYTNGYDAFLPSVRKSNSTHGWQSFLLTSEFHAFMGDVLSKATDDGEIVCPVIERDSWRFDVVELALMFIFDLLFHLSLEKNILDRWSARFIQIFSSHPLVTEAFVSSIAERTFCVYQNWIRAYAVECSDEHSRRAALQIFAAAIQRQLSKATEQELLQEWSCRWDLEWKHQLGQIRNGGQNSTRMPTDLSTAGLDDVTKIGTSSTAIGIILSFITLLLELSPRIVQSRIELFYFIQLLARNEGMEGKLLRLAMSHAQIPIRVFCVAFRDKFNQTGFTHEHLVKLKVLFPGSCLGSNFALGMSKHESQNILQMGMNSDRGNQFMLTSYDLRLCMEAFASLIGLPHCVSEDITFDTGDIVRGRAVIRLTPLAVKALEAIYEESKTTSKFGLTKREIEQHIRACGIRGIPPQKIDQIMGKHAIIDHDNEAMKVLPFEGFLDYYQTYACSNNNNDNQILQELQVFGFRPDLSQCEHKVRWSIDSAGNKRSFTTHESIAMDVASSQNSLMEYCPFRELGLWNPYFLWYSLETDKVTAQYIFAALAYGYDSDTMALELLRQFHSPQHRWDTQISHVCRTGLRLLAAMPDDKQQHRINTIMLGVLNEDGVGLLAHAREINRYSVNEQHERYEKCVNMLNDLKKQRAIEKWMEQNQAEMAFLEPENEPEVMNQQQSRGDSSVRRGGNNHYQSHQMSDYDDEDDEFDDDDSPRLDALSHMYQELVVDNCGFLDINGVYKRNGYCDEVPKYSKPGIYEGNQVDFMLFRCKLSDGTRRWYISIVPGNIHPGTTKDIDFYFTTAHDATSFPPETAWSTIPQRGVDPAPRVLPGNSMMHQQQSDDQSKDYI